MNKRIPKLRFREFSGEWKSGKLGFLSDVRDGTHDSPNYKSKGYPLITSKNLLLNGKISFENVNFISLDDYVNINKRSKVEKGDILFGMIGTIGNPVLVEEEGFAIKNVALIKEKEDLLNIFLVYYLFSNNILKQFFLNKVGGTQKFISLTTIRTLLINFSIKKEQQKIASFLSSIDKKIQNLELKKQNFEEYKKGVMQKIFDFNYLHKIKKIKFKTLGKLCLINKGEQINKNMLNQKGRFPVINGGKLPSGYYSKYNKTSNMITISEGGNSCGYVNFINSNFWSGGHCYTLENLKINVNYLYQYLKFNEAKIMRLRVGSGLPNIQKKDINNFIIEFPSDEEQQKIASFLSSIDKKLEFTNLELEKMKEFKKGLLQQMFV